MALEDNLRHLGAGDLFSAIPELSEDMGAEPFGTETVMGFLNRLKDSATPEEAITLSAYMLQPRLAVWWGHECLRSASEVLAPLDEAMLDSAAAWVGDPSEENRYGAMAMAQSADDKTPGVWVAFSAAWSGGSMAPAEFDPVPVPHFLCGRTANIAVLGALSLSDPAVRGQRIANFVNMAEVLAQAD